MKFCVDEYSHNLYTYWYLNIKIYYNYNSVTSCNTCLHIVLYQFLHNPFMLGQWKGKINNVKVSFYFR